MNNTTTTTFKLLQRLPAWWAKRREIRQQAAARRACPAATLAASGIPPEVRTTWSRLGPEEFPGLPTDDGAWLRCSIALAQFFEACRLQRDHGPCALPSRGADSVWHAWLEADAAGLAAWQQQHFGSAFPHHDADSLGAPLEASLARAWAGACRSEGRHPLSRRLPLVFALDGQLRLPTGWAYGHEGGALVHRQIDGFGRPSGAAVAHAAVGAGGLVALGLLSGADVRSHRRRADGGSSCGSSCGSSVGGGCGGGGDGSASCGSSCGSSCGGGCGG